jgi:uncharacterized protein YegL/serine/threonine protein kinase
MRRLPVYIVLDTSASTKDEAFEAMRKGLKALIEELRSDPQALETVVLSVIVFADKAEQLIPLVPLTEFVMPELQTLSISERSLGKALLFLKECMKEEVILSDANRKGDFKPKVLLFIDEPPTDDWYKEAKSLKEFCKSDFIILAISPAVDKDALRELSDILIRCQDISSGILIELLYAEIIEAIEATVKTSSVVNGNTSLSNKCKVAVLENGKHVEYLPEMIGEGGMKRVYFTADKRSVVCFYKDQLGIRDTNRLARLEAIVGKYNPTIHPITGKYFADLFCWPMGIVTEPEFGVIMPVIPEEFFFSAGIFKGKEKNGRLYSHPKLRKMLPNDEIGNWLGYLMLCKRMARAIRKMHMNGLAHSDLSCNSILINPSRGTCMIINIVDSIIVPGIFPPDILGTPGYMAPEVLGTNRLPVTDPNRKLPSNLTDLHALPVLFYEYLLRRHPLKGPKVNSTISTEEDEFFSMGSKAIFIENPHDTSNHWSNSKDWPELKPTYDILGKSLQDLFYKAFVEGLHNPKARPTADQWERALYISEDMLIPCGNKTCPEQWFIYIEGKTPRCPWCGWKLDHPLPILDFHYEDFNGLFRSEGHSLVCWDGRDLYKWHVFSNIQNVLGVDTQVQARVQYYKGQWILWNLNLDSMVSPAGNPVPVKQATYLKEGDRITLSNKDKGRHAFVRMIK